MNITEQSDQGVIIHQLSGRFDATTADMVKDKLLMAIQEPKVRLIIDCSQLKYVSSIGLRALIIAAKKATSLQGKLLLCAMTPQVRQVFDLAGFSSVVPIVATREEALASLV